VAAAGERARTLVRDHGRHQHRDQPDQAPDLHRHARSAPARAAHGRFTADSVLPGVATGTLPITARLWMYASWPASHDDGWPGAAVYGYGFQCSGPSACAL